jgi:hypothetical protein
MEIAEILGIMDVSIHTNFENSKWNSFQTVVVQNLQKLRNFGQKSPMAYFGSDIRTLTKMF